MYANVSTDYRAEHEVQVLTNLEFNNNNFNPHREVSANHSCGGAVTGLLVVADGDVSFLASRDPKLLTNGLGIM